MKKFVSALILLFTVTVSANAMSYEQAREQALFLTDKMAYELNLSEAQYEAAYEINLDYLMSIRTQDDLFGIYWRQRNLDLSYVLFDWQYSTFCDALYFYRPLYWNAGYWRFRIYARYPTETTSTSVVRTLSPSIAAVTAGDTTADGRGIEPITSDRNPTDATSECATDSGAETTVRDTEACSATETAAAHPS